MPPSCDFVPCLGKNSKICGPMFWKIAKARGDRFSIHLFSAESIARILVVSFLPSLSAVGCASLRRRMAADLPIVGSRILVTLLIPDQCDAWRHKAIPAPQLVRRAEAEMGEWPSRQSSRFRTGSK